MKEIKTLYERLKLCIFDAHINMFDFIKILDKI